MSQALYPMKTFKVLDPLINISEHREFAILEGGSQVTFKPYPALSYNATYIRFNCPPPSQSTVVSRHVKVSVPVEITLTGTAPVGEGIIQAGHDGLRAYPISSVTSTLSASINGGSVSIQMSDIIHPLSRYNTGIQLKDRDYSTTPAKVDCYQRYQDQILSNKNSLGTYNDGYDNARGAFPLNITLNSATSAIVSTTLTELMYISPFVFGKDDKAGFQGVETMTIDFTLANLARIWCHANTAPTRTITNIAVRITGNPTLLFKYVTPSIIRPIARYLVYPWYNVQRFPTSESANVLPNGVSTIDSQSIRLNSVPYRMYIFARKKTQLLTFEDSDTYMSLEGLTVNFANASGLLASMSKEQIYAMSVKNGCNMSWAEWSGLTPAMSTYKATVTTPTNVGLVGSVACVEFGTDIALPPNVAQGMLGQYELQVQATFKNINQVDTLAGYTFYMIVISSGTFTISDGIGIKQVGVISETDVLNSSTAKMIDYNDIKDAYGGDFWSGLKHFGEKIFSGVKKGIEKVAPVIQKGIEVGLPIAQKLAPIALKLLPLLGLGVKDVIVDQKGDVYYKKTGKKIMDRGGNIFKGGMIGGTVVGGKKKRKYKKRGGKKMSKSDLRSMLY